jgi:hypothetical protein
LTGRRHQSAKDAVGFDQEVALVVFVADFVAARVRGVFTKWVAGRAWRWRVSVCFMSEIVAQQARQAPASGAQISNHSVRYVQALWFV